MRLEENDGSCGNAGRIWRSIRFLSVDTGEILFSQAARGAEIQTFKAACAFGIIDAGEVIHDGNRAVFAVFLASFAACAAHQAAFAG